MNKYHLSKSSLRNLDGVNPELVDVVKLAIQITKVDFGIPSTGGYRTAAMQNKLFLDGKSQLDGFDKKSKHQTGRAVDVFAWVDGAVSYDPHHLAMVACAMLQAANKLGVNLAWGGHFASVNNKINGVQHGWDMPHFEVA